MYTGRCPPHREGRFSFCVYTSYPFLLFLVFTWMEEIFFSKTSPCGKVLEKNGTAVPSSP